MNHPKPERSVIASWVDLIDTGETLLRAGLRADYGPEGVEPAYRQWRERQRLERDRRLDKLLAALSRAERPG